MDDVVQVRSVYEQSKVLQTYKRSYQLSNIKFTWYSNGYINAIVCCCKIDGQYVLKSLSQFGILLGTYQIPLEDGEIIYGDVIRDEYFKENLLIVNEKGDIFIFDLPFINNGRKIQGSEDPSIDI